eukprot:396751-Amphidinium_carterae.1
MRRAKWTTSSSRTQIKSSPYCDRFPKYAARPSLADCKNDAVLRQRAKVVRVWVHGLPDPVIWKRTGST